MEYNARMSELPLTKVDPRDIEIGLLKENISKLANQLEKYNIHEVARDGYAIKYIKEDRLVLVKVGNKFGTNTDRVVMQGGTVVTATESAIKEVSDKIVKFLNSFKLRTVSIK